MKLADMVASLPSLTANERKVLQTALSSYADDDPLDLELLDAVQAHTGERVNLVSFKGTKHYRVWVKNQDEFHEVMRITLSPEIDRKTIRIAAKRFMVGLLIEYLKQSHKPITLPNICAELGNMKKIIDESFPGYLDNKLGGVIMGKLGGAK